MFTQFPGPDHHFSAYYENNSLLIQFMMGEFIQTRQLTLRIKSLIHEHLESEEKFYAIYPSLIQTLRELIGSSARHEQHSFSLWSNGSLTKLKVYCEQFSRNSSHQHKRHINLHMATHQAWLSAMHNLELLNSLCIASYKNPETVLPLISLKRTFNTLQIRFNQIVRSLPRVLNDYKSDENVILCLLRKRDQLIEIYGEDFLQRFKWPFKSKELVQLLVERYQVRGFEALVPTIQQIFETKEGCCDSH